jgi:hypothetical protein
VQVLLPLSSNRTALVFNALDVHQDGEARYRVATHFGVQPHDLKAPRVSLKHRPASGRWCVAG